VWVEKRSRVRGDDDKRVTLPAGRAAFAECDAFTLRRWTEACSSPTADVALSFVCDEAAAQAVAQAVRAAGRRAWVQRAHVADDTQVAALAMDAARVQRMLAVNVFGSSCCAREAAFRLTTRYGGSGGATVDVSSVCDCFRPSLNETSCQEAAPPKSADGRYGKTCIKGICGHSRPAGQEQRNAKAQCPSSPSHPACRAANVEWFAQTA